MNNRFQRRSIGDNLGEANSIRPPSGQGESAAEFRYQGQGEGLLDNDLLPTRGEGKIVAPRPIGGSSQKR